MSDRVEALLFDFGGVVMDVDFKRTFVRWAEHAGGNPALIGQRMATDEAYKRHERGAMDASAYFAHLRSLFGLKLSDAQMLDGWNAIFNGEMPGIAAALKLVRDKIPIYGFTNSNAAHEAAWKGIYDDVLSNFTAIFNSSSIGLRKPDAAAFDYVVKKIAVPAPRILFFDDLLENVEGAQACGLQAVHVTSSDTVPQTLASLWG